VESENLGEMLSQTIIVVATALAEGVVGNIYVLHCESTESGGEVVYGNHSPGRDRPAHSR
jgi:hypothetical protein